jgi:putative hydrolase of the HAD superfamily
MIKAILFDCFGVLVGKGFEYTYRLGGGDPLKDSDFINDTLGQANLGLISDDEFRQAMSQKLGLSLDEWQQVVTEAEQPDLELLAYIKQLRVNYKTAVLSNANSGVVERKIGPDRIKDCFDVVVISADIGLIKPDPQAYEYAADKFGVALDECVFIDDSAWFVDEARQIGMQAIEYQNFGQMKVELAKILADSKD